MHVGEAARVAVLADDAKGGPDFYELLRKGVPLSFWCFDLLSLEDEALCELPLRLRRAELRKLLPVGNLHFSEAFDDPVVLQAAETNRLEGIVSKRADMLYRSGRRPEWIEVKTVVWRDTNQDRYEKLTGG